MELDLDIGIEPPEFRQQGQHVGAAERRDRGDAQPPGRRTALVADRRLCALELAQRRRTAFVEQPALVGQAELAGRALQQPHAEPPLEALYVLADGDGRYAELLGRRGEAA